MTKEAWRDEIGEGKEERTRESRRAQQRPMENFVATRKTVTVVKSKVYIYKQKMLMWILFSDNPVKLASPAFVQNARRFRNPESSIRPYYFNEEFLKSLRCDTNGYRRWIWEMLLCMLFSDNATFLH